MFISLGACQIDSNPSELASAVADLLIDPEEGRARAGKGLEIVRQNRGALAHLLKLLEPLIGDNRSG